MGRILSIRRILNSYGFVFFSKMYQTSENKNLDTSQQYDYFCVKLDKATCFSSLFYGLNINNVRLFVCLFKKCAFLVFCYFLKFCSNNLRSLTLNSILNCSVRVVITNYLFQSPSFSHSSLLHLPDKFPSCL